MLLKDQGKTPLKQGCQYAQVICMSLFLVILIILISRNNMDFSNPVPEENVMLLCCRSEYISLRKFVEVGFEKFIYFSISLIYKYNYNVK